MILRRYAQVTRNQGLFVLIVHSLFYVFVPHFMLPTILISREGRDNLWMASMAFGIASNGPSILFPNLSAYNWLHNRFRKPDIIYYLPKRYCYLGTEYTGFLFYMCLSKMIKIHTADATSWWCRHCGILHNGWVNPSTYSHNTCSSMQVEEQSTKGKYFGI